MIRKIVILLALSCSLLFPQTDTTFISLRGFNSEIGKSHLLYATKHSTYSNDENFKDQFVDSTIFTYNILSTEDNSESFIVYGNDNIYYPENHLQYNRISDIEFLGNDPLKYIYSVNTVGIDPSGRIQRYDQPYSAEIIGHYQDIYISPNNVNEIYAVAGNWIIKSFDAGLTWSYDTFSNMIQKDPYIHYLTFSPFDDSIIFGVNKANNIEQSNDTGKTFIEITSSGNWNSDTELHFDHDQNYFYSLTKTDSIYNFNSLNLSQNKINSIFTSRNKIYLCSDDSISGKIIFSSGSQIYNSSDYGNSFEEIIDLNDKIVGIYCVSNTDTIYAATEYRIYELSGNSKVVVKEMNIEEIPNYYPLQIGNKWYYEQMELEKQIMPTWNFVATDTFQVEVIADTLMLNGQSYFVLDRAFDLSKFVRTDIKGIYYYNIEDSSDVLIYNYDSDENERYEVNFDSFFSITRNQDSKFYKFEDSLCTFSFDSEYIIPYSISFSENIGPIYWYSAHHEPIKYNLVGCKINGKNFGDSILVNVEKISNKVPFNISLSQNYPNPFNPTTTINYTIPNVASGTNLSKVILKVYDILGKEVSTLINESKSPGEYKIDFDASTLSSGIYYYRLKTEEFIQTKKMILLK